MRRERMRELKLQRLRCATTPPGGLIRHLHIHPSTSRMRLLLSAGCLGQARARDVEYLSLE